MMVEGTFLHVVNECEFLQDLRTFDYMRFHDLIFLIVESGWFVQHTVRDTDLSDIMQKCCLPQCLALFLIITKPLRNQNRILRYTHRMLACIFILRIHRSGDGEHRFISHFNLVFRKLEFPLLHCNRPLDLCADHKPRHIEHCQCEYEDRIQPEPPVIIDFLFLLDRISALCHNRLSFAV